MPGTPVERASGNVADLGTITPSAMSGGSLVILALQIWSNTSNNLAALPTGTMAADMETINGRAWHFLAPSDDTVHEWNNFNLPNWGAQNESVAIVWGVLASGGTDGSETIIVNTSSGNTDYTVLEVSDPDPNYPIRQHILDGAVTHGEAEVTINFAETPLAASMKAAFGVARRYSASASMGGYSGWSNTDNSTADDALNWQYESGLTATTFGATPGGTIVADNGLALGGVELREPIANGAPGPEPGAQYTHTSVAGTTHTTPSVSVTEGDLILCRCTGRDGTTATSVSGLTWDGGGTLDSGFNSGAFAQIVGSSNFGTDDVFTEWWWAKAGATESQTITMTLNASIGYKGVHPIIIPGTGVTWTDDLIGLSVANGAASAVGGTAVTATLGSVASSSICLAGFMGSDDAAAVFGPSDRDSTLQDFWDLETGTQDEGQNQTNFMLHWPGANGGGFGGIFGDTATTHDQDNGVAYAAFELQMPAAASSVPGIEVFRFFPGETF